MNKNGQKKLLAALAVFAMIACAFVAVMPSADAEDSPATGSEKDVVEWTTATTAPDANKAYYIDADVAKENSPITIDVASKAGVKLYIEAGAVVKLKGNDSNTVQLAIATGFDEIATTGIGTVSYYSDSIVTAKPTTVDNQTTALTYGFSSAAALGDTKAVEYKIADAKFDTYNPAMVPAVSTFNLTNGMRISIPNGAIIPGGFTVNAGALEGGVFTAVNTVEFSGTPYTTSGSGASPITYNAAVVASAAMTFSWDGTDLTLNNGSSGTTKWDAGLMEVTKGKIKVNADAAIDDGDRIKGIAGNFISGRNVDIGATYADIGASYVYYGDWTGSQTITLNGGKVLFVAKNSSVSGKVTVTTANAGKTYTTTFEIDVETNNANVMAVTYDGTNPYNPSVTVIE